MNSSSVFNFNAPEIFQMHVYIGMLFEYMNEVLI